MKKLLITTTLILWVTTVVSGQVVERRIEEIRKIYSDTNSLIAEMQKAPALATVFSAELVVNRDLAPYPAVGIYQSKAVFYYTYGDRERNPYPDRLLKVRAVTKRSAREQVREYYYDKAGQAVFVFISEPGGDVEETRLYFATGRLVRMVGDGKETALTTKAAASVAVLARKESARLSAIFKAALES